MPSYTTNIFVVIPVFNRINYTLNCLADLKTQDFSGIQPIVVDGGSTDGTPEHVHAAHPSVVVLTSKQPLFWGGAMRLGIDWALERSSDDDFILMMNNDVSIESNLVSHLVETSNRFSRACVGGVVIDARRPDRVIDGGINIDWSSYKYRTTLEFPRDGHLKTDCDLLPGRAALLPVEVIRCSGSVDSSRFPHYLADYELTYRIKNLSNSLMIVDYRAKVKTWTEEGEELQKKLGRNILKKIFSRKSKSNVIDHINFIYKHAPKSLRHKLIYRLVRSNILQFIIFTIPGVKWIYRAALKIRVALSMIASIVKKFIRYS